MKDILQEIDYKQITKDYDYFFLAAHKKGEKEAAISAVGLHPEIFRAFGKYIKNMLDLEPQEGIKPMGVSEILGCILVGMEDDNLTRSTVLRKDFWEKEK